MHPFIKIFLFILTLLVCSALETDFLALVALLVTAVVFKSHRSYLTVMLRMRWLFLSILIVYAFSVPGELIPFFPLRFAPTYEGLLLGTTQLARLMIALALLNLLLSKTTKQELIAGLYLYLLPFRYLGLDAARFATRLILTLHYVEKLTEQNMQLLSFSTLHQAFDNDIYAKVSSVDLKRSRFNSIDKIILVCALLLTFWVLSGISM